MMPIDLLKIRRMVLLDQEVGSGIHMREQHWNRMLILIQQGMPT
jgi:hypothetical protein